MINNNLPKGYKQSEVGVIPEDWDVVKLGDVGSITTGSTPPTKDSCNYGDEYLFASPFDIETSKYINNTHKKLSEKGFNISRKIKKNSILFVCIGSTIGKIAIANKELTTNQQINSIFSYKYNNEYIFYTLLFINKKIKLIAGEQAVPILNKTEFSNIQISLPPKPEQEKIAEILATWDNAIEQQQALISKKQQLKKGLMQQILTGKTRFPAFTDDWKIVKLDEISEIYQPQTISQTDLTKNGYNVYGANGIIGKYFKYNHTLEQIAITCRGNTCGTVNYTKPKSWITGNAMIINLDKSTIAIKLFIYYLFLNTNFTYLISGSGQPQITGNIKNHKLALPSVPEQQKIAEVLSNADKEIELLNKELNELKQQKKSLMQKLLTGQVRVKI